MPTLQSYPQVVTARIADGDWSELIELELDDGSRRSLVSPRYVSSGHTVSRSQPADLHQDVRRFLEQTLP